MFVVFHELAHILLAPTDHSYTDEFACDRFAALLLLASDDQGILCGLWIGFTLMFAILLESGTYNESENHPSIWDRFYQVMALMPTKEGLILTKNWDVLLHIPQRVMEIELFEHQTRLVCLSRSHGRLQKAGWQRFGSEAIHEAARALSYEMVCLPSMSTAFSLFAMKTDDGGGWCHLVEFKLISAISSVKTFLRSDVNQAVMFVLEFIAAIADEPPPISEDVELFEELVRAQRKSNRKSNRNHEARVKLEQALLILSRLGCSTHNKDVKGIESVTVLIPTRTASFFFQ
jgi:hypothetical protein